MNLLSAMHILLKKLLILLEEETRLYSLLLHLLKQEKKAVVNSNINELNRVTEEKETLLPEIRIFEEDRIRIQAKFSEKLGYSEQNRTLTQLSQMVEEPFSTRLKALCSNLLSLTQSIREINISNKALLVHSLELTRSSLTILNNSIFPNTYYRNGKMQKGFQNGKLVSSSI